MLIALHSLQQSSPSMSAAYGVQAHVRQSKEHRTSFTGTSPQANSKMPNATPAGQDVSGVGIFFQVPEHDQGTAYVQHIVPRSSADRCGFIQIGDELLAAGEVGQKPTNIENKGLLVLREKILGKQGSFVVLHFRRKHTGEIYDIELMRGSPEYIEMMNVSTGLKEKQQNDMMRIHELENQVSSLQQQVQAYAAQIQVNEDPRIGPLEDELRARMDDLRRFEDMLLRAKDRTSEAIRNRDEVVEELEMMKRAQALEDKTSQIVVEDSDQFRGMQKDLEKAMQEKKALQEECEQVKQERDQLKQQLRQFKVRDRDLRACHHFLPCVGIGENVSLALQETRGMVRRSDLDRWHNQGEVEAQKQLLQAEMEKLERPGHAEDVKRLQREVRIELGIVQCCIFTGLMY